LPSNLRYFGLDFGLSDILRNTVPGTQHKWNENFAPIERVQDGKGEQSYSELLKDIFFIDTKGLGMIVCGLAKTRLFPESRS